MSISKCRGQLFDGASNMTRDQRGIATIILASNMTRDQRGAAQLSSWPGRRELCSVALGPRTDFTGYNLSDTQNK